MATSSNEPLTVHATITILELRGVKCLDTNPSFTKISSLKRLSNRFLLGGQSGPHYANMNESTDLVTSESKVKAVVSYHHNIVPKNHEKALETYMPSELMEEDVRDTDGKIILSCIWSSDEEKNKSSSINLFRDILRLEIDNGVYGKTEMVVPALVSLRVGLLTDNNDKIQTLGVATVTISETPQTLEMLVPVDSDNGEFSVRRKGIVSNAKALLRKDQGSFTKRYELLSWASLKIKLAVTDKPFDNDCKAYANPTGRPNAPIKFSIESPKFLSTPKTLSSLCRFNSFYKQRRKTNDCSQCVEGTLPQDQYAQVVNVNSLSTVKDPDLYCDGAMEIVLNAPNAELQERQTHMKPPGVNFNIEINKSTLSLISDTVSTSKSKETQDTNTNLSSDISSHDSLSSNQISSWRSFHDVSAPDMHSRLTPTKTGNLPQQIETTGGKIPTPSTIKDEMLFTEDVTTQLQNIVQGYMNSNNVSINEVKDGATIVDVEAPSVAETENNNLILAIKTSSSDKANESAELRNSPSILTDIIVTTPSEDASTAEAFLSASLDPLNAIRSRLTVTDPLQNDMIEGKPKSSGDATSILLLHEDEKSGSFYDVELSEDGAHLLPVDNQTHIQKDNVILEDQGEYEHFKHDSLQHTETNGPQLSQHNAKSNRNTNDFEGGLIELILSNSSVGELTLGSTFDFHSTTSKSFNIAMYDDNPNRTETDTFVKRLKSCGNTGYNFSEVIEDTVEGWKHITFNDFLCERSESNVDDESLTLKSNTSTLYNIDESLRTESGMDDNRLNRECRKDKIITPISHVFCREEKAKLETIHDLSTVAKTQSCDSNETSILWI